jgi:hypothetical protein
MKLSEAQYGSTLWVGKFPFSQRVSSLAVFSNRGLVLGFKDGVVEMWESGDSAFLPSPNISRWSLLLSHQGFYFYSLPFLFSPSLTSTSQFMKVW